MQMYAADTKNIIRAKSSRRGQISGDAAEEHQNPLPGTDPDSGFFAQ
jgi:hypothetical protein